MILVIVLSLLILGIALYQATQGLFSAMIMTVLTIVAAAIAFNFYEPLANLFVSYKRLGAYAHGLTLLVLFVVPLYALREIFDRLIRGNVVMGMWVDRIGGGIFGVLTGLLLVGMLWIIVQLLPFGPSILGCRPYDEFLSPGTGGSPRWASSFTLGMAKRLSSGSLCPLVEGSEFGRAHSDLQLEAFCNRNRPKGARASTPADALEIVQAYLVQAPKGKNAAAMDERDQQAIERIRDALPRNPLLTHREQQGQPKVLSVRVAVDQDARNDREDDEWWRLPATHFRLVTASGRSFYPVGYLTWSGGRWLFNTVADKQVAKIGEIRVEREWRSSGGPAKLIVDWIYKLPGKAEPRYIVFRRAAKAPLLTVIPGLPSPADKQGKQIALSFKAKRGKVLFTGPAKGRFLQPESIEVKKGTPRKPMVRGLDPDKLPPEIPELKRDGAKLTVARVVGPVAKIEQAGAAEKIQRLREFKAPSKDSLIVQVVCKINPGFGADADTQARLSRMNPQLILGNGQTIAHRGAYFLYDEGGEERVYFYYDWRRPPGRFDLEFAAALAANLKSGRSLRLVFVVPAKAGGRIEGLTFGVGATYEFYPDSPLACGGR